MTGRRSGRHLLVVDAAMVAAANAAVTQRGCLEQVMRRCGAAADETVNAGEGTPGRLSHYGAVAATYAALSAADPTDLTTLDQLQRCSWALGTVATQFTALTPGARALLVRVNRALQKDTALTAQGVVLDDLTGSRRHMLGPLDHAELDRLRTGVEVARQVLHTGWRQDSRACQRFSKTVAIDGRARHGTPAARVVAATIAGTIVGALTCPRPSDPMSFASLMGLAHGSHQIVSAVLAARHHRQGDLHAPR